MDIDIIELSKDSAKFVLSGTNPAFANGIRRAMIADVPTLAIEYVNLYDNTSVLYDEQLGLRLALVPLTTDDGDYVPQSDCSCGAVGGTGCPNCEVSLRLDVEGPKMVYSGDFISADPKVHPADEKIPLVELKEGQRVMLEAIAHVGYGHDHVRWQAGVACGYKHLPMVEVEPCPECGNVLVECPDHSVFMARSIENLDEKDELKCVKCGHVRHIFDLTDPTLKVSYDSRTFVFSVESDGSYSSSELILKAADVIKGRAQEFSDILKDL
ncbi:MAG: DNA-directed RNA polymerase subunit D [Methanimicrococcus sp.]|nr:DNA-directed RNA polymerase subunit D [Methanimicrococcus sp.]